LSGVVRFSVSADPELLDEFDDLTKRLGYNRSNAIQVAMRDFLTEHAMEHEEGRIVGAITMIYDHHVHGLGEELTDIQHHNMEVITSTTHVHLDEANCLEILAVKGDVWEIKELAKNLMNTRGVKQLKISALKT